MNKYRFDSTQVKGDLVSSIIYFIIVFQIAQRLRLRILRNLERLEKHQNWG